MTVEPPPDHVLAAFGWPAVSRCRWARVGKAAGAAAKSCCRWSPTTPARPGRPRCARRCSSTACGWPGRCAPPTGVTWSSGWRADTFVAGTPEPRHDEVVSAAVRLHEATAKLERPRFLTQPPVAPWSDVDVFIAADRAAWEDRPLHALPPGARVSPGLRRRAAVGRADQPARGAAQADQEPRVSSCTATSTARCFSPVPPPRASPTSPRTGARHRGRPVSWSSTRCPGVRPTTGSSSAGTPLPEWPQMLLRALMFRLAVHALHPRSTASAFPGLARTAALVRLVDVDPCSQNRVAALSGNADPAVVGQHPLGAQQFQLPGRQVWRRSARRRDHPVPRQIRRVGAHDPADDARAGKPCRRSDVTVGCDAARRNGGDERRAPVSTCSSVTAATYRAPADRG